MLLRSVRPRTALVLSLVSLALLLAGIASIRIATSRRARKGPRSSSLDLPPLERLSRPLIR